VKKQIWICLLLLAIANANVERFIPFAKINFETNGTDSLIFDFERDSSGRAIKATISAFGKIYDMKKAELALFDSVPHMNSCSIVQAHTIIGRKENLEQIKQCIDAGAVCDYSKIKSESPEEREKFIIYCSQGNSKMLEIKIGRQGNVEIHLLE